jgi:hypothetical protein
MKVFSKIIFWAASFCAGWVLKDYPVVAGVLCAAAFCVARLIEADRLCDPTDPTGRRVIAETRDEIDAMLEARDIDARLPRIIYLRRRGRSWKAAGVACGITRQAVAKIVDRLPLSLLKRCGLRKK